MMMENLFQVPISQFPDFNILKLQSFRDLVKEKIFSLELWKSSQHVDSIVIPSIQENLNKLLDLQFAINRELEKRLT